MHCIPVAFKSVLFGKGMQRTFKKADILWRCAGSFAQPFLLKFEPNPLKMIFLEFKHVSKLVNFVHKMRSVAIQEDKRGHFPHWRLFPLPVTPQQKEKNYKNQSFGHFFFWYLPSRYAFRSLGAPTKNFWCSHWFRSVYIARTILSTQLALISVAFTACNHLYNVPHTKCLKKTPLKLTTWINFVSTTENRLSKYTDKDRKTLRAACVVSSVVIPPD